MPIKWTFEKLYQEALKYKTRGEFQKYSNSAYLTSLRRGILDQICSHMPKRSSRTRKWSFEQLYEEALKHKTRQEFNKNSNSAYQNAQKRGLLDKICHHMGESKTAAYTNEELRLEALKYIHRSEFQKKSIGMYSAARKRGILDEICSHMEYLSYPWTYEELRLEALKHKTRQEFNFNSNAYQAAYALGILDEICSHMEYTCYPWTYNELVIEALKYETRGDFQINSKGAYLSAYSKGILDEMCSHMKLSRGSSKDEKIIFDIIKEHFPTVKKIRDLSVKIEGKPYIHGFDIDIFVPELNLGIEYDGPYYHTFAGLRRSKSRDLWSDDDIHNYHEIKDAWFATKGIKILHIKWEDWNEDKQTCINRCLQFMYQYSSRVDEANLSILC